MTYGGPPLRGTGQQPPTPPSPFFDGTRLGLEGTMLATLSLAIPASLHVALSTTLGYARRITDLPAEPRMFAITGFVMVTILAVVALAMVFFFALAIPTMGYSMGLVALMLRWVSKRRPREKLVSTILGGIAGLLAGIGITAAALVLSNTEWGFSLYPAVFQWPEILSVDGIILLWFSLNPIVNAVAGAQIGWRLGKLLEELTAYYFWW